MIACLLVAGCTTPLVVGPRIVQSAAEIGQAVKTGIATLDVVRLEQIAARAETTGDVAQARQEELVWTTKVNSWRTGLRVYAAAVVVAAAGVRIAVAKRDVSMVQVVIDVLARAYAALRQVLADFDVKLPGGL